MIANEGDNIVCVDNVGYNSITIGKIYEVLDITDDGHFYFIKDDVGRGFYPYPIEYFMKLNEWRQQQINKVL